MVATVDTWDVAPEFPVELEPTALMLMSPLLTGTVQQRRKQVCVSVDSVQPTTRAWRLHWARATKTEKDRILAMWEASGRGTLAVAFTPPGGTSVPVRMPSSIDVNRTGPTTYSLSVLLEEVINA